MKDLLVIVAILIFCFELYHLLRGNWLRRFLKKKKGSAQPRILLVMKPKSEWDCPFCVKEKVEPHLAVYNSWIVVNGKMVGFYSMRRRK